jgi:hypothetical protein
VGAQDDNLQAFLRLKFHPIQVATGALGIAVSSSA